MPFFKGATGDITIKDSPMTDVHGDYHHYNHSRHENNTDSNNHISHNMTNSYNNSSTTREGDQNVYDSRTDGRIFSRLTFTSAQENPQKPHGATSMRTDQPYSPSETVDAAEISQRQRLESNEYNKHQYSRRESDSKHLLAATRRQHDTTEYSIQDNMGVDPDSEGAQSQPNNSPQS